MLYQDKGPCFPLRASEFISLPRLTEFLSLAHFVKASRSTQSHITSFVCLLAMSYSPRLCVIERSALPIFSVVFHSNLGLDHIYSPHLRVIESSAPPIFSLAFHSPDLNPSLPRHWRSRTLACWEIRSS